MAGTFASARLDDGVPVVIGNKKMSYGNYTNTGGSEGGNINTGLKAVEIMLLQTGGSAVSADQSAVVETLPCDGSAVTIANTADSDGFWLAIGT